MRVLLVLLLLAAAAPLLVKAGGFADDAVFIVACCATGDIPMSDEPEAACTENFCKQALSTQADALKAFEKKIEKDEDEATKNSFAESHRKGEGNDRKDYILQHLPSGTPTSHLPKYSGSALSFLEDQSSLSAHAILKAKTRLRRVQAAERSLTTSTNTYDAGKLHDSGRIKFKWGGNLRSDVTHLGDAVKTVFFWYVNAMKQWEKDTCLWFEEISTATLAFTDSRAEEGSSSNGLGTSSTNVKVEQPVYGTSRTRQCAEHELGHVIGLDHTNKRTDAFHDPAVAGDFITFDMNACVGEFDTYCRNNPAQTADPWVTGICNNVANQGFVNYVADHYVGVAGFGYTVGGPPAKLAKCLRYICIYGWIAQYEQSNSLTDSGAYEYGSIMHYPFDSCIQKKAGKSDGKGDKAPGVNKVTQNDRDIVNAIYNCKTLTINWANTKAAKTIKVHPDLVANDLIAYIQKKLGWNLDGKKLKKTDGSEITGTGKIGNLGTINVDPKFNI